MSYEDFAGQPRLSLWSFVFGPLAILPRSILGGLALTLLAVALTVLTQVGGLLLWLATPLLVRLYRRFATQKAGTAGFLFAVTAFLVLYLVLTFVALPNLAALSGRVPLPCGGDSPLQPATKWTCVLSRQYVKPELRSKLEALAQAMDKRNPGQVTYYLDANFPFGFDLPMLPHLTHRAGTTVDLAYAYQIESEGSWLPAEPPSPIGYWKYEAPGIEESQPCSSVESPLRWDMPWLQSWFPEAVMDEDRTHAMIAWLLNDMESAPTRRILLETHLTIRLSLTDPRVRFQGCEAARHDDHLHLEI